MMANEGEAHSGLTRDPWEALRQQTSARIALGRAGGSLPTAELVDFALSHAEARDAVHSQLDMQRLVGDLGRLDLPVLQLQSRAGDRRTYLLRPDLGRTLDEASRARLRQPENASSDVCVIVGDGLSAMAVQEHAPALLARLLPMLERSGLILAPISIVCMARVAIEDEIGATLRARCAVIVLGERPGLRAADSLGAYLVFDPRPGRSDAERNCVSNIRPGGLCIPAAAATIHYLITESLRRELSGVELKDERTGRQLGAYSSELKEMP